MNLGTARDLFEGYDGTEKDSLMQTVIVLREKFETLKRLDDMILDFLLPHPAPLLVFGRRSPPLVQIHFSPQSSAAIKIKDGGYNIRYEITEHSLAKIRPALQAKNGEEMIAAKIEDSDKVKAEIRGAVLAIEEKLK